MFSTAWRLLGSFPKDASIRKECTEVCTDAKQDGCEHSGIRSRKEGGAPRRCVSNGGATRSGKGRMPNKSGSLGQRPLWIIASLQAGRLDVLTIDPDGDGGYLPIFSFEEEAETFLRLSGDDGKMGWWSREATSGELVSVLLAPCAEVKQVALDPLPLSFGGVVLPFVSVKRDRFVQELMGERREVAGELVPA